MLKSPFSKWEEAETQATTFLSSSRRKTSAGIGTVIRECPLSGCRGFTGPVPPPLWIRVLCYSIVCVNSYHIILLRACQASLHPSFGRREGDLTVREARRYNVDDWIYGRERQCRSALFNPRRGSGKGLMASVPVCGLPGAGRSSRLAAIRGERR